MKMEESLNSEEDKRASTCYKTLDVVRPQDGEIGTRKEGTQRTVS